jgi:plastocyanin
VQFGGSLGTTYSPKCLTVSAGQTVTFSGNFDAHPLRPGAGVGTDNGDSPNPVPALDSGTSAQIAFPSAGFYPYFCLVHVNRGMVGTVQVR